MRIDYKIRAEIRAIKKLFEFVDLWFEWRREFMDCLEESLKQAESPEGKEGAR